MGKGKGKGGRGKGRSGDDKRVAGFDEVRRRNEEFDREAEDAKIAARRGKQEEDSDSDDEPAAPPTREIRGATSKGFGNTEPVDKEPASTIDDELAQDLAPIGMTDGGNKLSKKQREEKNKEEARRRYEKLHAEGKTEEYQKDMSRLAEIRLRREAAAKEKEEAAQKAEQERLAARGGMTKELKSALGGEVRKAGSRTATKKTERAAAVRTLPDDTFTMGDAPEPEAKPAANEPPPGLAEDDFM